MWRVRLMLCPTSVPALGDLYHKRLQWPSRHSQAEAGQAARLGSQPPDAQPPAHASAASPREQDVAGRNVAVHLTPK
jgi:hypothetical protein